MTGAGGVAARRRPPAEQLAGDQRRARSSSSSGASAVHLMAERFARRGVNSGTLPRANMLILRGRVGWAGISSNLHPHVALDATAGDVQAGLPDPASSRVWRGATRQKERRKRAWRKRNVGQGAARLLVRHLALSKAPSPCPACLCGVACLLMARACRGVRVRSVNSPEDNRVPPYAIRDSWVGPSSVCSCPGRRPDPARLLGLALQALGCEHLGTAGPPRADSEAAVRLCGPAVADDRPRTQGRARSTPMRASRSRSTARRIRCRRTRRDQEQQRRPLGPLLPALRAAHERQPVLPTLSSRASPRRPHPHPHPTLTQTEP